jgi:hypothetical protein
MDRCFALEDPALSVLRVGLRVPFHDIDVLDEETVLFSVDLRTLPTLPLSLPAMIFTLSSFLILIDSLIISFLHDAGAAD